MSENTSLFERNIDLGIKAGYIIFNEDRSRITYICLREYSTSFKNPEETIRASYFSELVLDYQYPNKKIDIEVTVPRRTPEDRADIVVYEDDELKKPFIIVECKKDGISDAEYKQAIEQAFGNANSIRGKFAIVVAGITKTAFDVAGFKPNEREKNVVADIPIKYGKAPKYRFIKGSKEKELQIVSRDELIRALEKCHQTVWQGGKLAPTIAFDEVSKLLFCKLKDEKDGTKKGDPYSFQIGTHESSDEVYDRVNAIYLEAKNEDSEVFKEEIRLEAKIVYNVVEHIQGLAINKIDLDTKGIAFERFMQDFFKGKMGQFFTPRDIVKFCVSILNPKQSDLILDPACGSGGFLLNTLDTIREFAEANYDETEARDYWHKFAQNNLFGIEINDQIARVCKMNMIIHDDGHTNVISTDSLRKLDEIRNIHKGFKKDRFDIILTNPPFGADVKKSEKDYLDTFTLGKKRKNQKTEILFIERCLEFVKQGSGLIGIVLPDSITVNSSLQYVRDYILENSQILAVLSLPDFAFSHYGANVKSSLLFLRRISPKEKLQNYSIFMALIEKIGYTASGKDDIENDLPMVERYLHQFRSKPSQLKIDLKYSDQIFLVNSDELKGKRIDPKGYSPVFKELKSRIKNGAKSTIKLKDCISSSQAGEWGKDPNELPDENEVLCYVLRNTNFDNSFNLNLQDIAVRYIKKEKINKLQLKENELLVEKSGGSPVQPVGRVALIKGLPKDKPVVFSNFLQKIVIKEDEFTSKFIYSYLRTLYHMGYMEYIQNQTTGIKNLIMKEFYDIDVVHLDAVTQTEIAMTYINTIDESLNIIQDAYENLYESRAKVEKQILK